MSTLISVTGNSPLYTPYLEANGAFMDERDDVFAAQIYCRSSTWIMQTWPMNGNLERTRRMKLLPRARPG